MIETFILAGRRKTGCLLVLGVLAISAPALPESVTAQDEGARDRTEFYDQRYALEDPYTKRTNNHGEGFEELYGTRNFRVILKGVAYRGGANNKWNRNGRRDNRNPLPDDGLLSLCEEGFSKSYYLYSSNFDTAPGVTRCESPVDGARTLDYFQASPFDETDSQLMLENVYDTIQDRSSGPVYLHCWNGWHASGLIAAKILRQFCGLSAEEAIAYWDRNTDGHNKEPRYESIRRRIREFTPDPQLAIDAETAARICP